jgi:hypothetical protein
MAKMKPSLVSVGTFWLISFARGANLSRRIASGFSVASSPFIPWCNDRNEARIAFQSRERCKARPESAMLVAESRHAA